MYLRKVESLIVSDELFAGKRPTSTGKHFKFDIHYKIVDK